MAYSEQEAPWGPSANDIISRLGHYLGPPAAPEKLKDYSDHHAATYHFPDAYVGSNVKLRDTINNLVLRSPQNWATSIGLPFMQIQNTTVEWDEIHFDVRMLQRVPYEGVSRMTTSLKRARRDRVVRRGLGMMIENDFYATEAGRQHFANTLTSIRYCIQETLNFDVLFSYLTCGNYDFRYDLRKAQRPVSSAKLALRHELLMYAACQKEVLGLDKAVEEVKFRMSRYGVKPNLMIIPPQLALYMSTAPDEKTLYAAGGPKADALFESGMEGFVTRAFRDLGVVTSDPFAITEEEEAVQMLLRHSQVGEHYFMSSPRLELPIWDTHTDGTPGVGPRGFCDVVIYDEEGDRHVRISWKEALLATMAHELLSEQVHGGNGALFGDVSLSPQNVSSGITLGQWFYTALVWAYFNEKGTAELAKWREERSYVVEEEEEEGGPARGPASAAPTGEPLDAEVLLGARTDAETGTKQSGDRLVSKIVRFCRATIKEIKEMKEVEKLSVGIAEALNEIEKPERVVHICLARPFIEHRMHSAIIAVAGQDTGRTLFGPADMQLAANVQVKVIEGHYTGHFKSVITKPENVFVARDISCASYVAGGNTEFFAQNTESGICSVENFKLRLEERLAPDNAQHERAASIMAFPMSDAQKRGSSVDTCITVTTRLLPWETTPAGDGNHKAFPGGSAYFDAVHQKLQLHHVHYGEDQRASQGQEFMSNGSINNALCFLGPHRVFNPYSRRILQLVPGQGHFGPDAVPGDARWRRGESVSLKHAREAMTEAPVVPPES